MKLTDLSQQWARLCYAARGCSNSGSIPGVRAARRALPGERRGPAAASAPPAAACGPAQAEWWQRLPQLPARLSVCFRRRPPPAQLPSASTIGQPPPGSGH